MAPTTIRVAVGTVVVAALLAAAPATAGAAVPWCGNDQQAGDRLPDAVAGQQIHVVYAFPSDGVDRFASAASPITTDVAALDAWWRREDPTRTPRLDLFAFPGCAAGMGQLDLSAVRLPQPASAYRALQTRLQRLATDLGAAGLNHRFKKYLVFYDGIVDDTDACGTGFLAGEQGGTAGYTAIFLQAEPGLAGCGTLGLEDELAATVAHELLHGFGAVPQGAPHACARDLGHICGDDRDVLQATAQGRPLSEYGLDPGRDDYYGHSGAWLDVRDSSWLQRLDVPDFSLVVTPVGATAGESVASDVPGISCPSACAGAFESGTRVTLTPAPTLRGRRFVGWRGDCTGTGACEVVLDAERRVEAVWGRGSYLVGVHVVGRGRVTTTNFGCSTTCGKLFTVGRTVLFRARPAKGWRFMRWSGACRGRATCRVAVTAPRRVAATFTRVST